MKWINASHEMPPKDDYYVVRLESSDENSDDYMYAGFWFDNGEWIYLDEYLIDGNWEVTHFIIPDIIDKYNILR